MLVYPNNFMCTLSLIFSQIHTGEAFLEPKPQRLEISIDGTRCQQFLASRKHTPPFKCASTQVTESGILRALL